MAQDIEQAVVTYLNGDAGLTALQGAQKTYYRRAVSSAVMPWSIVTNSGGMRERMTIPLFSEANDTLSIYVESNNQFSGKAIADKIVELLENYRGDMPPASYGSSAGLVEDCHIRCGTTRDLEGYGGTFKYIITAYVRYRFDTQYPAANVVV